MNSMTRAKVVAEEILKSIDLPDSAYETARKRYEDFGEWLEKSPKSKSAACNPHVYPQGSFRLGTAIKPIGDDEYDLDIGCKLQTGISKGTHTQKQLKDLLGNDLEKYRLERGVKEQAESKHRCWRIKYQDELSFHMDAVPCIPANEERQHLLEERMIKSGAERNLAATVAKHAVSITDDRNPSYCSISDDWLISNSEGFAKWFESRMRQAVRLLESRAGMAQVAKVDDLPMYKWRTPLQQCVQILKRHRDLMYKDDSDRKPISVIITTLAARSYQGEGTLEDAMKAILSRMGEFVSPTVPRISNPVNDAEDFADKWQTTEGLSLGLEDNFWKWLKRVREDFGALGQSDNVDRLVEDAMNKFGSSLDKNELGKKIGVGVSVAAGGGTGLASATPKKPVDPQGGGRFG